MMLTSNVLSSGLKVGFDRLSSRAAANYVKKKDSYTSQHRNSGHIKNCFDEEALLMRIKEGKAKCIYKCNARRKTMTAS